MTTMTGQTTWEDMNDYLVHSGMTAGEIMDAVSERKQTEAGLKKVWLTENEQMLLKKLFQEAVAGINLSWTEMELTIPLSVPEALGLKSIHRKLFFSRVVTDDPHLG